MVKIVIPFIQPPELPSCVLLRECVCFFRMEILITFIHLYLAMVCDCMVGRCHFVEKGGGGGGYLLSQV